MQKGEDAQHHEGSTPKKKKTLQRDLEMMKAPKKHKNTKRKH
jgi:hypothetical protein